MSNKIILITFLLLLNACNGSDSKSNSDEEAPLPNSVKIDETQYFRVMSPKSCTQKSKNRFIYQVMHDSYLWANAVPELDYSSNEYNSSQKMLDALKSRKDKFSFLIDAQTAQSFFEEGKNNDFGMGFSLDRLDETNYALVVRFVYPSSPAQKQGVKRGDVIKLVHNKVITEESLDEIVDILEKQKSINFTFLEKSGSEIKKSITKKSYDIETTLYANTFINSDKSKTVGYFVFQDFIGNANAQMDNVFQTFKRNNVNELILDLRYNGGGAGNIANHLASLIGGVNSSEHIFNQVHFNQTYSQYNEISYFEKSQPHALNLNRVFVITTHATCSSSELVINALKASANHIEVIQIGKTTCGKPYGYIGAGRFCDKSLYAINIESKNGDGIGGYVDGLVPTCPAQDNYFKSFGDTTEDSLAEALYYIENNSCSKANASKQKKIEHPMVKQQNSLKLPEDGFRRIMNAY